MNIDKNIEIASLFSLYGKLLTDKQQQIMHCFFNLNFGLSEIAEEFSITRQAANNVITKCSATLKQIEDKLSFYKRGIR